MIFCCLEKCNSLLEVSGGTVGLSDKKETIRMNHLPKKSTLADANKSRKVEFFEEIYNVLLKKYSFVLSDEIIELEVNKGSTKTKLKLRKIKYYDSEHKRSFEFISNLFEFRADTIAALYKTRWQIELLFKQIKQKYPL